MSRPRRLYYEMSEQQLRRMGRCPWETASGMPWTRRCGKKVQPGFIYCPEHVRDFQELYPHRPLSEIRSRMRRDPSRGASAGYVELVDRVLQHGYGMHIPRAEAAFLARSEAAGVSPRVAAEILARAAHVKAAEREGRSLEPGWSRRIKRRSR